MSGPDLKAIDSHFEFGENWLDYASKVTQRHLDYAIQCMQRLLSVEDLSGRSLLDVGCGSGIHSVAAAKLGASVSSLDLDPNCLAATKSLADKFGVADCIEIQEKSVFELSPDADGCYDYVYSWGVLHHTGAMWDAIIAAASCVQNDGMIALALYRKTKLCRFWNHEKRAYSSMPRFIQWPIQLAYGGIYLAAQCLVLGKGPKSMREESLNARGMNWWHDVHDWLGGFPYESARPSEVKSFMHDSGFKLIQGFHDEDFISRGLLGSGCAEYLFKRSASGQSGLKQQVSE